ncbi:MAG: hypothetical protein H7Z74_13535 [Anaerolineae bacterium]|nr:hypothetical protein [Gemmatimonadaceae bacterium]
MNRWLVKGALCCGALATLALDVSGQETGRADRRRPKRLLYTALGAGIGALTGGSYVAVQGVEQPGSCASRGCVLTVTVATGGIIGYLIGREFDQLHSLRYRGERPLKPVDISAPLTGEPTILSARDGLIAVGGTTGIQLFRAGTKLQAAAPRATGIRGISAVDIAPAGALALGAVSGFYVFPATEGRGILLRDGEVSAVATAPGRAYYGYGDRIEVAPLNAEIPRRWPGADTGSPVRDLDYDSARDILWAATDSTLIGLRPDGDSLVQLGRVAIPMGARRLSGRGDRVAIAFGETGVRVMDVSNSSAPIEVGAWAGARFSYDVSLVGRRLFVAGGPEGLFVLDVSGQQPRVVGLARELGFAAALVSEGPHTYILDRRDNALRRILSDFR